jgi:hypothetical protein
LGVNLESGGIVASVAIASSYQTRDQRLRP